MSFLTSLGHGKNHRERDEETKHLRVRAMRDNLRKGLPRILGRRKAVQPDNRQDTGRLRGLCRWPRRGLHRGVQRRLGPAMRGLPRRSRPLSIKNIFMVDI